jgi:predicted MPP superfamily phosphohydrolase
MASFIKFLTLFTFILGSAYFYAGLRLAEGLGLSGVGLYLFWFLIFILVLMIPISYFLSQASPFERLQAIFSYMAFTGLGFFTILFSLILFKDIIEILIAIVGVESINSMILIPVMRQFQWLSEPGFFAFSIALSLLLTAVLLTIYGFYQSHLRLKTVIVPVKIKNLHPDLEGFSIVQISDVHIGPTIKGKFLTRVVARINHLKPDMVAITGDLVDGPASKLKHHLLPLGEIKSKFGTFYITGNHEYYSGVLSWITEIKKLGITVLLNENRIIKNKDATLTVAGVTDLKAGAFIREHHSDPTRAIQGGETSDFKLLLAHQPNSIYQAVGLGYDLQLSGHTHGGQYFPGNLLIYLFQKFVAGLHSYKGMQLYVSRGTGYWGPPLRIGAPSEITRLILSKE